MDDTQHQELQRLIDAAPLGAPKKCLPFFDDDDDDDDDDLVPDLPHDWKPPSFST
jgi:hypothetical protein